MVSATALAAPPNCHPPMSRPIDHSWVWTVPGVSPLLKPRDPVSLRIVEELMAAMLTTNGLRIRLHGCDCLTEGGRPRKGVAFPCHHVLASGQEKALRQILKIEDLTEGVSGEHTLDGAARKLALSRHRGRPGVWGDPNAKDGYHHSRLPVEATDAKPNTPEKDEVFYERFKRGESLFHPDDPRYETPLPEEEGEGVEYDD